MFTTGREEMLAAIKKKTKSKRTRNNSTTTTFIRVKKKIKPWYALQVPKSTLHHLHPLYLCFQHFNTNHLLHPAPLSLPCRTHGMLRWSMTKQRETAISFLASTQSTLPIELNNFSEAFQDACLVSGNARRILGPSF